MPWASALGLADVLALMLTAAWLAARHERRAAPGVTHHRKKLTSVGS